MNFNTLMSAMMEPPKSGKLKWNWDYFSECLRGVERVDTILSEIQRVSPPLSGKIQSADQASITFRDLTRDEYRVARSLLGAGKGNKSSSGTSLSIIHEKDGIKFFFFWGIPDTCTVTPVETVIPEHTETKAQIICDEPMLDAVFDAAEAAA